MEYIEYKRSGKKMAYRREKLKEDGVLKKVVRGEDRIH
jgi:hypothetical protein